MSEYTPDNWVVLRIKDSKYFIIRYKVLAGWSGGYLQGDSWRINSGISEVTEDGDYLLFHGYSGSVYRCHKKAYRLTMAIAGVYNSLKQNEGFEDQIYLMPEDTDWMKIDWIIK